MRLAEMKVRYCREILNPIFLIGINLFLTYINCQGPGESFKCEVIKTTQCKDLPYNQTIFPNLQNQTSQDEAVLSLQTFSPLLQSRCSPQMLPLLCLYFFPVCTILESPIPPCRLLCKQARAGCEILLVRFGFKWPVFLECDLFPASGLCVGENHTSSESSTIPTSGHVFPEDRFRPTTDIPFITSNISQYGDDVVGFPIFLVVSTMHDIILYDMATNDLINLYAGIDQGAAIDFHYQKRWIFWAGQGDSRIYRGSLTLDVLRDIRLVVDAVSPTIESLAVDWITGHIFWLESYPSKIRVATLDGKDPTTLLANHLSNPKSLIIDPLEGYLFWIDWVGTLYSPSANVERYDLNNNRHEVIFNITKAILPGMGRPIGLTTDRKHKRLYWVDAKSESIQSIDYNGNDFQIILRNGKPKNNYLTEPRDIAIFGENMFWSDTLTQSIIKAKKNGSYVRKLKTLTASPPLDIKVFHGDKQEFGIVNYKIHLEASPISASVCLRPATFILFYCIVSNMHSIVSF